jgi:hypothetical protein
MEGNLKGNNIRIAQDGIEKKRLYFSAGAHNGTFIQGIPRGHRAYLVAAGISGHHGIKLPPASGKEQD